MTGKILPQKLAGSPALPEGISRSLHSGIVTFLLEQDSTAIAKFAFSLILPCGILLGSAFPNPAYDTPLLVNPSKYFFDLSKTVPLHTPFSSPISERTPMRQKGEVFTMKKRYRTPAPPGAVKTHDRGRIHRVCGSAFCLQHELAEFIRQKAITRGSRPIITILLSPTSCLPLSETDRRIRQDRRQLKPDIRRRTSGTAPTAACRGGAGGGFRPCFA